MYISLTWRNPCTLSITFEIVSRDLPKRESHSRLEEREVRERRGVASKDPSESPVGRYFFDLRISFQIRRRSAPASVAQVDGERKDLPTVMRLQKTGAKSEASLFSLPLPILWYIQEILSESQYRMLRFLELRDPQLKFRIKNSKCYVLENFPIPLAVRLWECTNLKGAFSVWRIRFGCVLFLEIFCFFNEFVRLLTLASFPLLQIWLPPISKSGMNRICAILWSFVCTKE